MDMKFKWTVNPAGNNIRIPTDEIYLRTINTVFDSQEDAEKVADRLTKEYGFAHCTIQCQQGEYQLKGCLYTCDPSITNSRNVYVIANDKDYDRLENEEFGQRTFVVVDLDKNEHVNHIPTVESTYPWFVCNQVWLKDVSVRKLDDNRGYRILGTVFDQTQFNCFGV